MEAEQAASEDEPPSLLWGLDPVFSAFARLYIKDLLLMRESRQVPGIYLYKSHPIFQVDILGTVVFKREREDFYSYGVDDGTGVINCLCWKSEKWKEPEEPFKGGRAASSSSAVGPSGGFNVEEQLRRLQQAQRGASMLEIGDLLRVRGSVKTSRGQREIMSSNFYKVSDPVMALQISWMQELPQLYRRCYQKPFPLSDGEPGTCATTTGGQASFSSLLGRATQTLRDFLREKEVRRFRPYDVEHLLLPLVPQLPPLTGSEQASAAGPSVPSHTRHLLSETLRILQQEGTLFRRVLSQDELYHVTEQDKDLLMAIRDVIQQDSKRQKYAEKGCHILHILSSVRRRYSQSLSRQALEVGLRFLESSSDIISTSDCHYTVV
ncbi:CST complex subunit STN1 isoform X2 [Clupea harengus]|uniref:CST complex subunit STN1 n=1 Tax=Clupea harengus TaxID=7950 RepID=A0A6P3VHX2_CLUHA|nr:CST complex subunit STN1 isoform X2 [Clupea harengus]